MERLLHDAGLSAGMKVLNIGSGRGDVSLMATACVGATGTVVGIDRDPEVVSFATARAKERGLRNVTFVVGDLSSAGRHGAPFDAIVERRVLMYLSDLDAVVRILASILRPGGVFAFQEADGTLTPSVQGEFPLHERAIGWLWQTVRREGGNPATGLILPGLLDKAGMSVEGFGRSAFRVRAFEAVTRAWWVS